VCSMDRVYNCGRSSFVLKRFCEVQSELFLFYGRLLVLQTINAFPARNRRPAHTKEEVDLYGTKDKGLDSFVRHQETLVFHFVE